MDFIITLVKFCSLVVMLLMLADWIYLARKYMLEGIIKIKNSFDAEDDFEKNFGRLVGIIIIVFLIIIMPLNIILLLLSWADMISLNIIYSFFAATSIVFCLPVLGYTGEMLAEMSIIKMEPFEQNGETYNLYYLPSGFVIEGNLSLSKKGLTVLPDLSEVIVRGNFYCSSNNLTSLKGAPKEVGGDFNCSNNQLTSLKGAPKEVGGDFNCSNNQLTSLKWAPKEVGRYFLCNNNPLDKEEIRKVETQNKKTTARIKEIQEMERIEFERRIAEAEKQRLEAEQEKEAKQLKFEHNNACFYFDKANSVDYKSISHFENGDLCLKSGAKISLSEDAYKKDKEKFEKWLKKENAIHTDNAHYTLSSGKVLYYKDIYFNRRDGEGWIRVNGEAVEVSRKDYFSVKRGYEEWLIELLKD